MRAMSATSPRPARSSILLAAALVAALGFAVGPVAHPAPARAVTASYVEDLIVKWVNRARANRGIKPLRVGSALTQLAGNRATTLARTEKLAHPSCLACMFRAYGIAFRYCGEVVGMTSYPWGWDAARSIYLGWKHSSMHWSLLMSRHMKRIGVGVAYRSSDRTTWAAADLAGG